MTGVSYPGISQLFVGSTSPPSLAAITPMSVIGNVMDTSASRAAMPQGSNIGVRTAPNSSALNINVNIGWWSADRLCRAFNNPDGTVTPRYVKTKLLADSTPPLNRQRKQAAYGVAKTEWDAKLKPAAAPAAAAPAAAEPVAPS